ncbi:MAG: 4-hydroxyphenylacetate 3-hydroxylase C-terminal domain-containing protein [Actinomycetaceae bacterium]|nr:4-hydroxyphenylacetate 3-hydroxylase C-terminal domain-containing protein [Actinomycetaceae bacterium]
MCLDSMLRDASPTDYGLWAPGPTLAMDTFAAQVSGRLTEILIKISGSGAVMQASASDLEAPLLRDLVARYMSRCSVDAEGKAAVFRLVRGLVGTEFGARQHIYELWNRGDPVRNRMSLADAIEGIGDVERAVLDELADTSMLSDV